MEKTKQTIKKISYALMLPIELGAITLLGFIREGWEAQAGKALAFGLALDFFVRLKVVTEPYFKQK